MLICCLAIRTKSANNAYMNIKSANQLDNTFLIAMPSMQETWFGQSLVLVCEHNQESSMGIVVNKPLGMQLGELYEQMEIRCTDMNLRGIPIYKGGPVQSERGFILHTGYKDAPGTLQISKNLYLSTSKEVLIDIAKGEGPDRFLVALGYAGWAEHQLLEEICANAWLHSPVSEELLFETPTHLRWEEAAMKVGVEIKHLCLAAGHA